MKPKKWILWCLGLVLVTMVFAFAGEKREKEAEEQIAFSALPQVVQTAIKQQAEGGEIKEIEKITKDDKVMYEAEILKHGKEIDFVFSAAGELLARETEDMDHEEDDHHHKYSRENDDDDDEHGIACDTIKALIECAKARGAEVKEIEHLEVYKIELEINGKELELMVSMEDDDDEDDNGRNGDDEDEEVLVSINEVPEAVKATILKHAQNGKVAEIEREDEEGQVVYEVEILKDGKEIELEISAKGILLDDDDDDDDNGHDHDDDD